MAAEGQKAKGVAALLVHESLLANLPIRVDFLLHMRYCVATQRCGGVTFGRASKAFN